MSATNHKIYNDERYDNISIDKSLVSNGTQNITSSFHKSRVRSHPDMIAISGEVFSDVCTWATYDGKDIVTLSMVFNKSSSGIDDVVEFDFPVPLQRDASPGFIHFVDQRVVVEETSKTRYRVYVRQSGNVPPAGNLYSFIMQYNVVSPNLPIA